MYDADERQMIHPPKSTSALTLVFPWISSSCQSLFEVFSPLWLGTVLSGAAAPICCKWKEGKREGGRKEGGTREGGREGRQGGRRKGGKREGGREEKGGGWWWEYEYLTTCIINHISRYCSSYHDTTSVTMVAMGVSYPYGATPTKYSIWFVLYYMYFESKGMYTNTQLVLTVRPSQSC